MQFYSLHIDAAIIIILIFFYGRDLIDCNERQLCIKQFLPEFCFVVAAFAFSQYSILLVSFLGSAAGRERSSDTEAGCLLQRAAGQTGGEGMAISYHCFSSRCICSSPYICLKTNNQHYSSLSWLRSEEAKQLCHCLQECHFVCL